MISWGETRVRGFVQGAVLVAALFLGPRLAAAQAAISDAPPALRIAPAEAVVAPGGEIRFTVPTDATGPLAWRVVPASLGVITPDGTFLAGDQPGRGIVRVEAFAHGEDHGAAAVIGHALVRVTDPAAAIRLRIRPSAAVLLPGRSVLFEAAVTRLGAEGVDRDPQIHWSVEPPTLGLISPDGVLTPFGDVDDAESGGRPGTGLGVDDVPRHGSDVDGFVVARATIDGVLLEARASVRRASTAPAGVALDVKPPFITLRPGTDVQVGVFIAGNPLLGEVSPSWSVMPPTLGSITPDGLFTANQNLETPASDEFGRREGMLIVTATLRDGTLASGSARVVILPLPIVALTEMHVRPPEATVRVGESVRFRVGTSSGVDPVGAMHDLDAPRVKWHVQPERAGTIGADGVFMPNARLALIGDLEREPRFEARIIAEVHVSPSEVIRGSARVVILLPAVGGSRLAVEPNPAEVTAPAPLRFVGRLDGRDVGTLPVSVSWDLSPASLGSITPDGIFLPNPVPPIVGGAVRRGRARLIVSQGEITLEANAAVTVRY